MPAITFIDPSGHTRIVQAKSGDSLMETATKLGIPGIDADCGGACSCATCQVYVDSQWLDRLSAMSSSEQAMLDFAPAVQPNSRLACQIRVSDELDGLVVSTPATQR